MRGLAAAIAGAGCVASVAGDPGLDGLAVRELSPATIVPGTALVVAGAGFVDARTGACSLHLVGAAGARPVDVVWPADFVDATALVVAIDGDAFAAIGNGDFHGSATVEVVLATDRHRYASAPRAVDLAFRSQLAPMLRAIASRGVVFVNDEIAVAGDGFLLGGAEGDTVVRLAGCFTPEAGGACRPVSAVDIALVPTASRSRTQASFAFSPRVAGIGPGTFTGTVAIVNRPARAAAVATATVEVRYDLVTAQVFAIDPPAASLGQFVFVRGGGFAGGEPGTATELELSATLQRTGGAATAIETTLVPEVIAGRLARYVVNSDDALGHAIDLRSETGRLTGTITPVVSYGGARVRGQPASIALAIAPVRQVVHLDFAASFVEGLRDFGMRAVDQQIRERILAVCREVYRGVNLEFRVTPPVDFALFESVALVGVDPNDQGLFGYDNSPGKDSGNLRLYDRLGGVNAQIQADGYPGFGGVFVRSLLGFSQHPGGLATSLAGADPMFDRIFDPFRADRGGAPITAVDLTGGVAQLADGAACPATDRALQIRCAIFVLGNLLGGTLAHEIGHSLGLARPYQDGFHDDGDAPNRLMDAGEARPFLERAQLSGQGPAVFCADEYAYLRRILASPEPATSVARPRC